MVPYSCPSCDLFKMKRVSNSSEDIQVSLPGHEQTDPGQAKQRPSNCLSKHPLTPHYISTVETSPSRKRAVRKQISDHTLKTKSMLTCNIQFAASLLSSQPPLTTRPRPDPSVPSNQRTGKQRSPYAQARYLGASFISYQGFHLERLHW
ncbi:hypothetical protein CDAR_196022 [Caerostris darwini]|uniref:Uncharacterized protein n=1 Tax=Caerostris darwini TaxID=1538125 RepID=A0AAV4MGD5_9ARAC|nr:hypothetical protein CDAR_196022 [Caerostris darwini]